MNQKVLETLRQLAREKRTGILTCQGERVTRHLVFKNGGISSARSSDDNERLGEVMVRKGSITEQHLQDATIFASKGRKLGDVLVELRIKSESDIADSVRTQLLEVASNVVIHPPKKLAFTSTKDVIQVIADPVPVLDVIMEAARRTPAIGDQIQELLADDRHVSLTKESSELMQCVAMQPHEAFILTRVTGNEPVRHVFDVSPLPEEQTARAVLGHLAVGILELRELEPEDGIARA